MKKNEFGVFEVTVPGKDGKPAVPHNSKIKVLALLLSREKTLTGDRCRL